MLAHSRYRHALEVGRSHINCAMLKRATLAIHPSLELKILVAGLRPYSLNKESPDPRQSIGDCHIH